MPRSFELPWKGPLGQAVHISDISKGIEALSARAWAFRLGLKSENNSGQKLPYPDDCKKVLLVRNDRVGDMILTTPLIAALKKAGIQRLGVLASKSNQAVVLSNPHVDEVVVYDGSRSNGAPLECEPYDLAIDLSGDFRLNGLLGVVRSMAPHRVGPHHKFSFPFYTAAVRMASEEMYEADRMVRLVSFLGNLEPEPLALHPHGQEIKEAEAILGSYATDKAYILVSVGARRKTHRLGPSTWASLLIEMKNLTGLDLLLSWGPGEFKLARAVAQKLKGMAKVLPPTGVQVLGCLAQRAALFLVLETGSLHVGIASGAKVMALVGPLRNPRWHPSEGPALAYVEGLRMNDISPDDVAQAWEKLKK